MAKKKQQSLCELTLRTSTSTRSGCAKSDISLGLLAALADSVVVGRCMWYRDERRWYIDGVASRSDALLHVHNTSTCYSDELHVTSPHLLSVSI